MSRLSVRRLAAMALLAALCLALPAAATAPRHVAKDPATAPSLWDELLIWIGNFLTGPSQTRGGAKDGTVPSAPIPGGVSHPNMDLSIGVDPNGNS